jgi:hypothetical protein
MRTVTFSDAAVAKFVGDNFVAAWHDRGPGFCNKEKESERWIYERRYEAYTTKNICTFFLKPDGDVFFYAAGYYAPTFFLEIAQSALTLSQDPTRGATLSARAKRIAGELGVAPCTARARSRRSTAPKATWCRSVSYRGDKHEHGTRCDLVTGMGYKYLASVYEQFARGTALPKIADVQSNYLFGDPFTEESATQRTIDTSAFLAAVDNGPDAAPGRPVTEIDRRQADAAARIEKLNTRLLAMEFDAAGRRALQDEILRLVEALPRP